MNFSETIARFPDNFAVKVFPDLEESVTGAMLRENSGKCAAWLQKQGDRSIGIHMSNCPEFLYLLTGALRAGIRPVLFNALKPADSDLPMFTRDRVRGILEEAEDGSFSKYDWKPDEPIVSLQTSGTGGGAQKFVERRSSGFYVKHNGFSSMLNVLRRFIDVKIYNCLPWYHITGFVFLYASLLYGMGTEVTASKFNPDTMRQYLNTTTPNFLITTPTMLTRCIGTGDLIMPPYIVCAGERLTHETIRLIDSRYRSQVLMSIYGSTETGAVASLIYNFRSVKASGRLLTALLMKMEKTGTVFNRKTLPPDCTGVISKRTKVKVLKDGVEQPEGAVGEIAVHNSYMVDSIRTEFFNTGDVGYVKGGLLFIVGRSSYVINRSGEKIIPSEIEHVIAGFAGVEEVTVFGIPSVTHGEDICAVVKCEDGEPLFRIEDLEQLPKFMLPQHLLFLKEFPINATGKTDLAALKTEMEKRFAQGRI